MVVLHYAHTFEISKFHFQFQSDPTFDISYYVCNSQPTNGPTYRNVYVILNMSQTHAKR